MPSKPPFRAENVGSLLRPPALYAKRKEMCETNRVPDDLKVVEDDAIRRVVRLQRGLGIKTITDGELRRGFFFDGVFNKLEGMVTIPNRPIHTFKPYIPHIAMMYAAGVQAAETVFCNAKIRRTKPFYVDEFKFLKCITPPQDVKYLKVTMCSPTWFHQRHGSDQTYNTSVYGSDLAYFKDLSVAYRQEIKELYSLGCRHVQFDDPTFCYFCDDNMIAEMVRFGVDHEILLKTYIHAINLITNGRPHDLTISLHMCRGNYKGGIHFSEGGYERIAFRMFNTLDVDVFYLEYDTKRAGDFAPLRYLPLKKMVVLGLVTTKKPKLESIEEIKARVYEAADVLCNGTPKRSREVALRQLCISTQCGFASVWEGNPLTTEDQRKKLALVVEIARQIWPSDFC